MNFWDFFKSPDKETKKNLSRLHDKLAALFPQDDEEDIVKMACMAGLLARVAYCDLDLNDNEVIRMKELLKQFTFLDAEHSEKVVETALEEIKDLSGLENHKYCPPLNNLLDNQQRYQLLESLFAVAASDGEVSGQESEEIRNISKGLLLEHKHFISARATVSEKLGILKN
jgi:uncharacterized tellurite resistance protein B-like protein